MSSVQLPCGLRNYPVPHFLEWYVHAAGYSETPREWHLWMGLAAISAALANRVYMERIIGKPLFPNQYIMLIGPSGLGKGNAMDQAAGLLSSVPMIELADGTTIDRINHYDGKISAQALINHLASRPNEEERFDEYGNRVPTKSRPPYIYLQTPELAMSVGHGPKAMEFVRHITEYYGGKAVLKDRTRSSGYFEVRNMCINWTSGTTFDWLISSIGRDDLKSGFMGRINVVIGHRGAIRYSDPVYPHDARYARQYLIDYLSAIASMQGEMMFTPEAEILRHHWHTQLRPPCTDDLLATYWDRQKEHATKLSMVLAAGDGCKMEVEPRHFADAVDLTNWLFERLPELFRVVNATEQLTHQEWAGRWIARRGTCSHSEFIKAINHRGVAATEAMHILTALQDREEISMEVKPNRGRLYKWIGGKE